MTKYAYSYAVLQYRHDVWVGEALNVGVLFFSEMARYLKMKTRTGRGRIANAYPDLDHSALRDAVTALELRFDKISTTSGLFLPKGSAIEVGEQVLTPNASSLSWGVTGSGVAENLPDALEKTYARFVGRYDQATGREVRTDDMVFEAVRRKLQLAELYQRVQPHVVHSRFATIPFDHAIENGMWHVIQPISFDSADENRMLDKATKWVGRLQSISDRANEVKPYFVTGKPSDQALLPQYRRMVDFLKASPMQPVVMDEAQAGELVAAVAEHLN